MRILGIETSCDETAVAVVADGQQILSSEIASQVEVHHPYGGVVPELASRHHVEAIAPLFERALERAAVSVSEIDAVAVTQGPGLIGALLVGFCFAKSFAYARQLPWVGVDHLQGHIHSVFLTASQPGPRFPFVALLASGGHTSLYHVKGYTHISVLGQTRDDAAGEAYDKVAKMLGLGYPGGKVIDDMAHAGDPQKVAFPRAFMGADSLDFSFSGLKSAVRRHLEINGSPNQTQMNDIAAGFQAAVIDVLAVKLMRAARTLQCDRIAVVGGVAANQGLRRRIESDAHQKGYAVHIPPLALCGDNAAMIAAAGYHQLQDGKRGQLSDDVYSRAPRGY